MAYVMLGRYFSTQAWESICTCCGLCCYEKYEERGAIVFTDTACRYLGSDMKCKVYKDRLETCEDCCDVTPEVVEKGELLPPECAYVEVANRLREEDAKRQTEPAWHPRRQERSEKGRR